METTASFRTAQQYLLALEAKKQAEKALADAKELLLRAYEIESVTEAVVDGKRIVATPVNNRKFDVAKLESLISGTMFRKVTSTKIDTDAFDKARASGQISGSVEDQIVTIKPTVRIDLENVEAPAVAV